MSRDRPERGSTPPVYAVLNPAMRGYDRLVAAIGSDSVELESTELIPLAGDFPGPLALRIEVRAFSIPELLRICRVYSDLDPGHWSQFGVFVEAVQGRGLLIPTGHCYVTRDPEIGRAFFTSGGARRADA